MSKFTAPEWEQNSDNAATEIQAKYSKKQKTQNGDSKQIDADSETYYAIQLSENETPTTPDKTNKTFILISS